MIIPSVGEWVEFVYRRIQTFPQEDGTDKIVPSNRYRVVGQVSYVGNTYIVVGTLPRRGGEVSYRSYRYDRMLELKRIQGGIDIVPPLKRGKSPAPQVAKENVPQLGEESDGFEC